MNTSSLCHLGEKLDSLIRRCRRQVLTYFLRPIALSRSSQCYLPLDSSLEAIGIKIQVINQGRIFTDGTCNISVISNRLLLPNVSWQYEYGNVLEDSRNYSLTQGSHFNCLPTVCRHTVVSLLSGGSGLYNYYHWLFDVLPRYFLVRDSLSIDFSAVKYLVPSLGHPFQSETLEQLSISLSQCIDATLCNHIRPDKLIVTSHPNPEPHRYQAWIVDRLRDAFLGLKQHATSTPSGECIYISRSDAPHQRLLLNEEELLHALAPFGVRRFILSALSFRQQIDLFSNARIVIGVHGAGFANLSFASRGAIVFELFSELYQPDMYERISRHNDLDYHKIVCRVSDSGLPQVAGLVIQRASIDLILRCLQASLGLN